MANSREIALKVLYACHCQDAWADGALKRELAKAKANGRDAALASRLVYGVEQNRLLLDHYLSAFSSRPLETLEPRVRDILRLGAYQLLMMDKIPSMAAVDESVKLTKQYAKNPKTAGFVNAVLRNLDRGRNDLPPLPRQSLERLSIQYSHPLWLVKEFALALKAKELEELLAAHNAPVPIFAQVNTLKTDPETLKGRLEAEGVTVQLHPWQKDCLVLGNTGNLEELSSFQEGCFYIQDPAARQAVLAAEPKAGEQVLDLCAAPGGKSFAAAIAMGNRGQVISRDIYPRKVQDLAASAHRLGLSCVGTQVADAAEEAGEIADLVIADVPCSGLGIIRKKPDIRYKNPDDLSSLPPIQAKILENAAGCVRPGGRLLYATCTLRKAENEGQVEGFLDKHKDFTLKTAQTLWPHRQGVDGFFYAVLRREVTP